MSLENHPVPLLLQNEATFYSSQTPYFITHTKYFYMELLSYCHGKRAEPTKEETNVSRGHVPCPRSSMTESKSDERIQTSSGSIFLIAEVSSRAPTGLPYSSRSDGAKQFAEPHLK